MNAAVLMLWIVVGPFFVRDFLATGPRGSAGHFLLCWLVALWLVATAAFILSLAWIVRGASVVSMRGEALTLEHKIASTRIGKPAIFALANVHDLRIERRRYKYRTANVIYAISFDYMDERWNLLSQLTGDQAESLLCGPLKGLEESTIAPDAR